MYLNSGSILSSLPQPSLWVHAKQDPKQEWKKKKKQIRKQTIRHRDNIKVKSDPKLLTRKE
jgi:hypothetical protein